MGPVSDQDIPCIPSSTNAVIEALALGDHEGEACRANAVPHLGGRALWVVEIGKPGTAVELAIGGLDLVWLEAIGRWLNDQSIETLNLLGTWVGDPSDDDSVAGVPCLKDGEWDVWLGALASNESSLGGEGHCTELRKRGGGQSLMPIVLRVRSR